MSSRLVKQVGEDFYLAEYKPGETPTDPRPHFTINGRLRTLPSETDSKLELEIGVYIGLSPYSLKSDASLVDVAREHKQVFDRAKDIADRNPHPYYTIKEDILKSKTPKPGLGAQLARALGDVFGLGHDIEYVVNTQVQLLREKAPKE